MEKNEKILFKRLSYDEFMQEVKNKNTRRKEFDGIELKNMNFDFEKLEYIVFKNCLLKNISFQGTIFEGIRFSNSFLEDCGFYDANAEMIQFYDCQLEEIEFFKTNLYGSSFDGSVLKEVNLNGANITNAIFSDSTLIDTNLDYSGFPLHCGSFDMKTDEEMLYQLLYHACKLDINTIKAKRIQNQLIPFANEWSGIEEHMLDKCNMQESRLKKLLRKLFLRGRGGI